MRQLIFTEREFAGVRAVCALAHNYPSPLVLEREARTEPGLSQVIRPLRLAGLVRREPGEPGGYRLSRSPAAITLSEVVLALSGQSEGTLPECARAERCTARRLWEKLRDSVGEILGPVTLSDLCTGDLAIESIPTILAWTERLAV